SEARDPDGCGLIVAQRRANSHRYNHAPLAAYRSMHVLYEDDGQLKAGTVLADHDQSLQVEAVSGKRQKIKAADVLLRFATPGPAETMTAAHTLAADLDANFLWEAVGDGEFGFDDLAREYYGAHPAPAEAAALAIL